MAHIEYNVTVYQDRDREFVARIRWTNKDRRHELVRGHFLKATDAWISIEKALAILGTNPVYLEKAPYEEYLWGTGWKIKWLQ